MQVTPIPESEWGPSTWALSKLYTAAGRTLFSLEFDLSETGIPDSDWDENDTAGVGTKFDKSNIVQDSSTGALYICQDSTSELAVWNKIKFE